MIGIGGLEGEIEDGRKKENERGLERERRRMERKREESEKEREKE